VPSERGVTVPPAVSGTQSFGKSVKLAVAIRGAGAAATEPVGPAFAATAAIAAQEGTAPGSVGLPNGLC
jgi:hypothetical protein